MISIISHILHPHQKGFSNLHSGKIPGFVKNNFLLPEQSLDQAGKPTLILDLAQALVDSSFESYTGDHDFVLRVNLNDSESKENVFMWKRPGLHQFLQSMAEIYEIVLFTSAERVYADAVVDVIDPSGLISHRLFKDSCSKGGIKDLSKLGRDLKRVIVVDDNPWSYALNPENGLSVSRFVFENKRQDRELLRLIPFLRISAKSSDLRTRVKMWNDLARIRSCACKAIINSQNIL